jgi:ABC-2 type transport system permease protein
MSTFTWLVRREFWENRAIWILPTAIGALILLAAMFGRFEVSIAEQSSPTAGLVLLGVCGASFYVTMGIYSAWYLLDCLYADRRDRSILFWKSLPISDSSAVLSKVFTALVAIPAVYFVAANLAALLIAVVVSIRLRYLAAALWHPGLWLDIQVTWLYVTVTSLIWYLPVAGWLLLVSAWAKRPPMLLAVLPPLALVLAERLFLGSGTIAKILGDRFGGYATAALQYPAHWQLALKNSAGTALPALRELLAPESFATDRAVWIGIVIGALAIAGAIQLRKRRTEV